MLTSRITEGENSNFKTILKKKNTDHHNGDLDIRFVVGVRFTHFKWLIFKELIWLIISQF